jgi:chloramphenicol O-acetyltransferase
MKWWWLILRYGTRVSLEGNVKVKLPLCLTKHHAMKTYWEMEI